MKRILLLFSLFVTAFTPGVFSSGVNAAPAQQEPKPPTPTPGPDGKIIYIVVEGDSCLRIEFLTGVPISQIKGLNQLDDNCNIFPGQRLIIGVGGPSVVTPTRDPLAPTATPFAIQLTPTPVPQDARLCVLLYEDINGDALRQETENVIQGGAVSVTGALNPFSASKDTEGGVDPSCFEEMPEGTYTISAAAPTDYFPTTEQTIILTIKGGEEVHVDFGVQRSAEPIASDGVSQPPSQSSILGWFGGALILAALGLGGYYWYAYIRRPSYKSPPSPPGIAR